SAVVTHPVEKFGELLVETLEKYFRRVGIRKRNTQIAPVYLYPIFQRQDIGHFKTVPGGMIHKPFVRMRADRLYAKLHSQRHIAGPRKTTGAVLLQRFHNHLVN